MELNRQLTSPLIQRLLFYLSLKYYSLLLKALSYYLMIDIFFNFRWRFGDIDINGVVLSVTNCS